MRRADQTHDVAVGFFRHRPISDSIFEGMPPTVSVSGIPAPKIHDGSIPRRSFDSAPDAEQGAAGRPGLVGRRFGGFALRQCWFGIHWLFSVSWPVASAQSLAQEMWPFPTKIDAKRLQSCLIETKQLIDALEGGYCIEGLSDAEISMDLAIALKAIENDGPIDLDHLKTLFAPTGPVKEIAIDSGWGDRFVHLASEFNTVTKNRKS